MLCEHCGHYDLYDTPTRAILCGFCGRKQDRDVYADDQLLSMEWPEFGEDVPLAEYNEENGRDLIGSEYDRLRDLTGWKPGTKYPMGVTSKADTMAAIGRLLG